VWPGSSLHKAGRVAIVRIHKGSGDVLREYKVPIKMHTHTLVQPNSWIALRLPSDTLKVLQIVPNT
jgi:hypothetical protein